MRLLLDANAMLKRYVAEPGSDAVEAVFGSGDAGDVQLLSSSLLPRASPERPAFPAANSPLATPKRAFGSGHSRRKVNVALADAGDSS